MIRRFALFFMALVTCLAPACQSITSAPKKAIGLAKVVTSPLLSPVSGKGRYNVGRESYSYTVKGMRYHVMSREAALRYSEKGNATWYGFEGGSKTATGERYNPWGMTAAHKTLPLGSHVRVTNLTNGQNVIVRINDRGPFGKGRIIDCSKGAANKLGFIKRGVVPVHIETVN